MKTNPSKNEERAAIELLRQTRVDVRLEDGAIVIAPQHSDVYCEARFGWHA